MNLLFIRFKRWQIERRKSEIDRRFRARLEEAKKKNDKDKVEEVKADWFLEIDLLVDRLDSLETDYLLSQARKLDLPTPSRPGPTDTGVEGDLWSQNAITGIWYLSTNGRTQLRNLIRTENRERHEQWARWVALFVGLLGAATGLAAVLQWKIMGEQLQEMRVANNLARDSAQLAQRAWVGIRSITMTEVLTTGNRPQAIITIENAGNTPASNSRVRALLVLTLDPFPEEPLYPQRATSGSIMVLSPRSEFTIPVLSVSTLSSEDVRLLNSGKAKIYVYGFVEYEDIFKARHKTTYCGLYVPGRRGLDACERYNTSD